jgi:acetamidase/formamidase
VLVIKRSGEPALVARSGLLRPQKLRVSNSGKGPHSIIGPIAVNKAEPRDVLEIRYERIRP